MNRPWWCEIADKPLVIRVQGIEKLTAQLENENAMDIRWWIFVPFIPELPRHHRTMHLNVRSRPPHALCFLLLPIFVGACCCFQKQTMPHNPRQVTDTWFNDSSMASLPLEFGFFGFLWSLEYFWAMCKVSSNTSMRTLTGRYSDHGNYNATYLQSNAVHLFTPTWCTAPGPPKKKHAGTHMVR